ncbi:MAG TPA: hypothetical protein VLY83_00660 [Methanoregula sp.]|nr:hypothetical protein [Methanoregula sp.]
MHLQAPDIAANATDAGLKAALMVKYRTTLVERLTEADLEELQSLLRNKFGPDRTIRQEYLEKFEYKLREYLHEETIRREMATLEALVALLRPEDLRS